METRQHFESECLRRRGVTATAVTAEIAAAVAAGVAGVTVPGAWSVATGVWLDVQDDEAKTYIDDVNDWRGRTSQVTVNLFVGTPADALTSVWTMTEFEPLMTVGTNYVGADYVAYSYAGGSGGGQFRIYIEGSTGHLFTEHFVFADRYQVKLRIVGDAQDSTVDTIIT